MFNAMLEGDDIWLTPRENIVYEDAKSSIVTGHTAIDNINIVN